MVSYIYVCICVCVCVSVSVYTPHIFIRLYIEGIFISWLLWIMLHLTWDDRYLLSILFSVSLVIYSEIGFGGSYDLLIIFGGIVILFSIVAVPICIPTSSVQGSLFSTSLPIFAISLSFWWYPLEQCERKFQCKVLVYVSLMISDVEHFSRPFGPLCVFFGKILLSSSAHFFIKVVGFCFVAIHLCEFCIYFGY